MPTIALKARGTAQEDKILLAANYFIKKNEEDHKGLTPLKLQKLLYYTKAWGLVFNKGNNIFPDDFQAWIHGPANLKVYEKFKGFDFEAPHPEILEKNFDIFSPKEKEILDMVWGVYGKFDGKYLEALTHTEAPWIEARQGLGDRDPSQNVISTESMKTFYEQRYATAKESSN